MSSLNSNLSASKSHSPFSASRLIASRRSRRSLSLKMSGPDAGQAIEAEKPHTLDDRLAVDNFVIQTNQDRLRIRSLARMVLTDEPYNVPIAGNVTGGRHREFAMATGEMSAPEYLAFNETWMGAALPYLANGGLLATFIDWRGYSIVDAAAVNLGLAPVNLVVWSKTNAGMGSLYRSQHELLPLFKKGDAPHINNVRLGKRGRWRSNVWTYPGASSLGSDARRGLAEHPTVKPSAMLEDALLDLTERGDIVLDPFLGSGSTLIAAHRTGRVCRGVEIDPLYVDLIIRRFETETGENAVLMETGETRQELAARRAQASAGAETRSSHKD